MILLKYLLIILILLSSISYSQSDSIINKKAQYKFTPQISGGQIEATTFLYVTEFGALIDIDIISKIEIDTKSFGLRLGVEYYSYFEAGGPTGGGPFTDYCLYGRHTIRMNDFWLTFLGGISYHTYNTTYYEDELLFRLGLEFKYNLIGNYLGILLKGSTSFREQTSFFGIGIFVGYFD
jgi:hypothetical protein